MSLVVTTNRAILASALLIPCMASIWLLVDRDSMRPSTFAASAALVIGVAAVALTTWRNGQATRTVTHLLHETEIRDAR